MAIFDVVSDHSDHHYADKKHDQISSTAKKTIMNEWRILEQNLPETIHVRAYETRIDLLRAVIVGSQGTPYADGLFFFDIKFPDNYPNKPPQVHYISHGLEVNPNLYKNGSVCLSLLNTWSGSPSEAWDPSRSTIFQVLLSIQALVLNDDPVFNEPASVFIMRLFRLKGTLPKDYKSTAFINTCRSALYVLRSPPRNFEGFVAEHFRGNASRILKACDDFTREGYYSLAYRKSMEELYPQLVNAFDENEAAMVNAVGDDVEAQLVMGFKKKDAQKLVRRREDRPERSILTTLTGIVGITLLLIILWLCWYLMKVIYSIIGYIAESVDS